MADPTPASVPAAQPASVPYRDGGPLSWDELFPTEAQPAPGSQGATTPQGGQPTQAQVAAQTAAANAAAFELKTKTGTVYKSAEDAIKGIEHKDALIEQLRQRYILERGIDPVTNQPVHLQTSQSQPANYMQDRKRYVDDLTQAAQKNDSEAIWNAQTKLIFDALAPLAPVMSKLAEQQAIETLSGEIKDIREFIGSEDYKRALEDAPGLSDAINRAKGDIQFNQQLSGLYKVAYRVSQGIRLPEILKAQPNQAAQPVRTTTAPATLAPATQTSVQASLHGGKASRDALIAQYEAQGVADRPLV